MDGYRYMIERNRLLRNLEEELSKLAGLPDSQRKAETERLQAEFDRKVAQLYAEVASEFPGERRKKARPISDPR
jgi:predicted nucleic acid-binding Zn ribbon protein